MIYKKSLNTFQANNFGVFGLSRCNDEIFLKLKIFGIKWLLGATVFDFDFLLLLLFSKNIFQA